MNNYCFATVITNINYEVCAGRLYQSLKYFNSSYPMEIIVTNNVDTSKLEFLNTNNIPYRTGEYLYFSNNDTRCLDRPWYKDTLSKINILTLTEYDYVCFLDADILIGKNIDFLFNNIDTTKDFNIIHREEVIDEKVISLIMGEIYLAKPSYQHFKEIKGDLYNQLALFQDDESMFNMLLSKNIYTYNELNIKIILEHGWEFNNIYHLSGAIKIWKIFDLVPELYYWFYKSPINYFISFLEKNINAIYQFRHYTYLSFMQINSQISQLIKTIEIPDEASNE